MRTEYMPLLTCMLCREAKKTGGIARVAAVPESSVGRSNAIEYVPTVDHCTFDFAAIAFAQQSVFLARQGQVA